MKQRLTYRASEERMLNRRFRKECPTRELFHDHASLRPGGRTRACERVWLKATFECVIVVRCSRPLQTDLWHQYQSSILGLSCISPDRRPSLARHKQPHAVHGHLLTPLSPYSSQTDLTRSIGDQQGLERRQPASEVAEQCVVHRWYLCGSCRVVTQALGL